MHTAYGRRASKRAFLNACSKRQTSLSLPLSRCQLFEGEECVVLCGDVSDTLLQLTLELEKDKALVFEVLWALWWEH